MEVVKYNSANTNIIVFDLKHFILHFLHKNKKTTY